MKLTRFFVVAAVVMMASLTASAHDFEVGGIYYDITSSTDMTVEVTYQGSSYSEYGDEYSGAVTIPENVTHESTTYSVTSIGNRAFNGCSSLTSITIPEGVTSIGYAAFSGCSSLTSITIPESVTSIGYSAFSGCSGELTVNCNIPSASSYSSGAFYGSDFTKVTIGEGVTSIGDYAFYECSSLTSITIPEGVTSIGCRAFYGTDWYNNQPDGVIYINKVLYEYKGTMPADTSIEVRAGTVSISPRAFVGCRSLKSITLPQSVTAIGYEAFYESWGLTSVTIPNGTIGKRAFSNTSLSSVIMSEGVTAIGIDAFWDCTNLKSVTIPNSLESVGEYAFKNCRKLKEVHIGSIESWCGIRFDMINHLNTILEGTNPLYYAGKLYLDGSLITDLVIPNTVTKINDYAFYGTTQFSSITIGDGVEEINKTHFTSYTKLTELTLGKKVRRVEAGSFATCDSLKKVTVNATQPPTADGSIFSDATYQNATLYVPQGSISRYQVMAGWSGFYNMSEIEGVEPDYLTIRQADNGEVGIAVDLGRTYKVRITPSVGWQIHTVTLDGKDMTAQMADDNTFTTPTLTGSAVLNVAYVKEGSAIGNAAVTKVAVRGQGGTISVEGAAQGEVIDIYTMAGALVASSTAQTATTQLTVPTGQVYIVTVGDMVVKIGM